MTDNKQYPELPTHFMLVQESFRDEVYLYTADQMRAYVDADRAMRAAQAAPAAVAVPDDRCQHCVNRSDGFYGSFAPECPLHNDDGTAHTQAAPQPVEHPWVASDTMRADLIADLHDVFDANGPETPQIVRDVIEYADSWLQVVIQRESERSARPQPAAPASQDAEDAAHIKNLCELVRMPNAEYVADAHNAAVKYLRLRARANQEHKLSERTAKEGGAT